MLEPAADGRRSLSWGLWAVVLCAFVLRIVYVMLQGGNLPPDTDGYRNIADNLIHGQGFSITPGIPTAYRPPVYPLFIAFTGFLPGGAWTVLWMQCLLGALVAAFAAKLARELVGDLFALVAAVAVAVDPYQVAICGMFMTEALFAFLVSAGFVLFIRALKASSAFFYAAAGVVLSLACLTRPEFMVFVPAAAVALFVWGRPRRRLLCFAALLIASCVLPAVWTARNKAALGVPVITTTHGGYTHRLPYNDIFYAQVVSGDHDIWDSASSSFSGWRSRVDAETQAMNEISRDRYNYTMARGFVSADVRRALSVALYEAGSFWRPLPHAAGGAVGLALGLFFAVLAALAVVGAVIALRWGPVIPLTLYLLAAETLVHMYYWSNVRMRVPFHPLIAVAAAVAVASLFRRKAPVGEPVRVAKGQPSWNPAS